MDNLMCNRKKLCSVTTKIIFVTTYQHSTWFNGFVFFPYLTTIREMPIDSGRSFPKIHPPKAICW